MAEEEDEVDILGDFSLDNLLSKDDGRLGSCYVSGVLGSQGAELLNCDYNIGSQWLLDAPNQPWYSSPEEAKSCERHQFNFPNALPNGVTESLPSTSQWEENESWNEKEKSLLEQGLDLFGTSWQRVSQFIGTKTLQQVKSYVTSRNLQFNRQVETLNLETSGHCPSDVFNFSELIDDMQIPASMEEVIAVVSTAQPTVPAVPRRCVSASSLSREISLGESSKRRGQDVIRMKGKRRKPQQPYSNSKKGIKVVQQSAKRNRLEVKVPPVIMLSAGEEVVKIKKEGTGDSDEDEEIDVDDDGDSTSEPAAVRIQRESQIEERRRAEAVLDIVQVKTMKEEIKERNIKEEAGEKEEDKSSAVMSGEEDSLQNSRSHQDVLEMIFSLPPPTKETCLDPNTISAEERSVHIEFFEGRTAKTPKRYLRIRNHILDCWQQNRPAYVTKTSVRSGLKHCGDVNCIGRIHAYLEQIGAINFGCGQARYMQPMIPSLPVVSARRRLSKDEMVALQQARIDAMRPRKKKKNPIILDGDGGYTITHSESGEAIHTTVFQDTPGRAKTPKGHTNRSSAIKLLTCSQYGGDKPAPFRVQMSVEALLVVDLHAHSSHTEVAGLLGGTYISEEGILHIRRALACRSNSSGVHCDMCPVSQTEASEALQRDGLEVVGWYHSHPTFLPNPSLQDLTTQRSMQQWFARTTAAPIVSFILTPYCPTNPSSASQYRCLTVDCNENTNSGCGTPYMFPVTVSADDLNVASMLKDMAAIFSLVEENHQVAVDFDSPFEAETSYKQKCVESAKLHLASCEPGVPPSLFHDVVEGVLQACSTLNLARGQKNKSDV